MRLVESSPAAGLPRRQLRPSFRYMAVSYEEPPARKAANDWRRFDDRPRGTFWSALLEVQRG
jgi:hypothetical protein